MSIQFSDTSTFKGLMQFYEREIGANRGFVSDNENRKKEFAADVNIALDEYIATAFRSEGTWQFDDSNHSKYPIITTDLVANQQDYTFLNDQEGNMILQVYKVLVKSGNEYVEIDPVDVNTQKDTRTFSDGVTNSGIPTRYDKLNSGIFVDPVPATTITDGLKVYINREASYFSYTDTTAKPGVPGIHHHFFYIKPAYDYARRNNLASLPRLEVEYYKLAGNPNDPDDLGQIGAYFARRTRDEQPRLSAANHDNK